MGAGSSPSATGPAATAADSCPTSRWALTRLHSKRCAGTLAVALAPRGITVNAVCPGITDDSIVNHLPPEACAAMLGWLRSGWTPSRRPGTPADIGGAVAALCSDDAAWITGQTIAADGGASLMNPEIPLDFQHP